MKEPILRHAMHVERAMTKPDGIMTNSSVNELMRNNYEKNGASDCLIRVSREEFDRLRLQMGIFGTYDKLGRLRVVYVDAGCRHGFKTMGTAIIYPEE